MITYHVIRPAEIQQELPRTTYNFAIRELADDDPKKADGYNYSAHSITVPSATPASAALVLLIADYDNSPAVNSFLLNGESVWLDKTTRVGLMNSIGVEISAGIQNTTLWFEGRSYTLPCTTAMELVSGIELYAIACYRVTAEHQAHVARLGQALVEAQNDYAEMIQARDYAREQGLPGPAAEELAAAREAQATALAAILGFDFTQGYPERPGINI